MADFNGVVLNVNDRVRVDFRMSIGTKRETVSVNTASLNIQADSGEQSSLVTGTQISDLSTNGRSIYTYIALAPGASDLMPSFQPPTSVGANSNVSFNGNRHGHNLYLLDGGENYDRGGAGTCSPQLRSKRVDLSATKAQIGGCRNREPHRTRRCRPV